MDVKIESASDFIDRHAAAQEILAASDPSRCLAKRLPPYLPTDFHQELVFSIERESIVVALAGAMQGDEPGTLLVSYVTVDPRCRDQGLGTALVSAMIHYMKKNDLQVLETGKYSNMGDEYLKKVVRRFADAVEIRENGVPYLPPARTAKP